MDKVAERDTKNLFMDVQAVLCTVIIALLAGGALSLYLPRKDCSAWQRRPFSCPEGQS